MNGLGLRVDVRPRIAVTTAILDVLADGIERRYRDISIAMRGRGLTETQIRNGLVSAQHRGRVLKRGTHSHYLYRINPAPPMDALKLAAVTQTMLRATEPAVAIESSLHPTWPATRLPRGFLPPANGPQLRIAA